MSQKIIAQGLAFCLTFALPSQGEVVQKYDEFTGKTTISVWPEKNWSGKTPRLFLNYSFQGKKVTQLRGLLFFSVIAPISSYSNCGQGVSGVIADGERVVTADDKDPSMATWPKIKALEDKSVELQNYVQLWGRYEPEEFKTIVNASEVKYQLCGDKDEVYTLTEEELQDLKQFTAIVMPPDAKPVDLDSFEIP